VIHSIPHNYHYCYYTAEIKKVKKCRYSWNPTLKVKIFDNSGRVIGEREGDCNNCYSLDIGEITTASVPYSSIEPSQNSCPQYKIWIKK